MKKENKLLNGALILTLSTLFVKVIGLIFKLPLSYVLTDEGMNYFNTAYTVYTFFYILSTAGVPKAISALVASDISNKKESSAISLSRFALKIFMFTGAVLSVLFFISAPFLSRIMGSEGSFPAMLVIAPSVAFVAAGGVLRGYFMGKMNFIPIAISEALSAVLKLLLGLLFAFVGIKLGCRVYGISALAISGVTLGSVVGFIYLFVIDRKEKRQLKIEKNTADSKALLSKILKISAPITASSAIASVLNLLDIAVVMNTLKKNGFSDLQANILYGNYTTLVVPMFNLVGAMLAPVSTVMLPAMIGAANKEQFEDLTKRAVRAVCYISLPICFFFAFFSLGSLELLFEDSSARMAAPLLSVTAPSFVLMGLTLVLNTAHEARGHYYVPLFSLTLGGIVKLIISSMLISNENIGLMAAPVGTIACYLISFIVSLLLFKSKRNTVLSIISSFTLFAFFSSVSISVVKLMEGYINIKNFYINSIICFGSYALIYFVLSLIPLFIWKKSIKNQQILQNS